MIWQSTAEFCGDIDDLPEKKQCCFLNKACLEGYKYKIIIGKTYTYKH